MISALQLIFMIFSLLLWSFSSDIIDKWRNLSWIAPTAIKKKIQIIGENSSIKPTAKAHKIKGPVPTFYA